MISDDDWESFEIQPSNRVLCVIEWKNRRLAFARQWYGTWEDLDGNPLNVKFAKRWRFATNYEKLPAKKKRPWAKDGKARMKTFAERQRERDKERTRYFENAPW